VDKAAAAPEHLELDTLEYQQPVAAAELAEQMV